MVVAFVGQACWSSDFFLLFLIGRIFQTRFEATLSRDLNDPGGGNNELKKIPDDYLGVLSNGLSNQNLVNFASFHLLSGI